MEDGYLQLKSTMNYFHKENLFVNKTHVLNQLAKQFKEEEKLPAIAFVFSRKNVETFANAITANILEFDSKVPYTIKNECDSIIKKLPKKYGEILWDGFHGSVLVSIWDCNWKSV